MSYDDDRTPPRVYSDAADAYVRGQSSPTIPLRRERNFRKTIQKIIDSPVTPGVLIGLLAAPVSIVVDVWFLQGFGLSQVGFGGCAGISAFVSGVGTWLAAKKLYSRH